MNPLLLGLVSYGLNKFSNSEENDRSTDMMALQNKYQQQNAFMSYSMQRKLTEDAPLLDKLGKFKSGVNTAFGQNGNVTSVASAPMADSPNVPSPLGNGQNINNSIGMLSQLSAQKSTIDLQNQQSKLVAAQTENQNIKNLTQLLHDQEEARKLGNDADKAKAEKIYQDKINTYADERLSSEANTSGSVAHIKANEAAVSGAYEANKVKIQEETIINLVKDGILTDAQADEARANIGLIHSSEAKNYSDIHRNDVLNKNTESDTTSKNLQNSYDSLTFSSRLVEAFENAKQSKLKTLAIKLQTMPKSISEHYTRSALFALDRITHGKGSAADYALVASQTAREAAVYGNEQAKDWTKILLGAIPGSSSGAASSNSNSPINFSTTSY